MNVIVNVVILRVSMIEVHQPVDIDILLVDVFNPLMLEGLYMYCPLINGVYT